MYFINILLRFVNLSTKFCIHFKELLLPTSAYCHCFPKISIAVYNYIQKHISKPFGTCWLHNVRSSVVRLIWIYIGNVKFRTMIVIDNIQSFHKFISMFIVYLHTKLQMPDYWFISHRRQTESWLQNSHRLHIFSLHSIKKIYLTKVVYQLKSN